MPFGYYYFNLSQYAREIYNDLGLRKSFIDKDRSYYKMFEQLYNFCKLYNDGFRTIYCPFYRFYDYN